MGRPWVESSGRVTHRCRRPGGPRLRAGRGGFAPMVRRSGREKPRGSFGRSLHPLGVLIRSRLATTPMPEPRDKPGALVWVRRPPFAFRLERPSRRSWVGTRLRSRFRLLWSPSNRSGDTRNVRHRTPCAQAKELSSFRAPHRDFASTNHPGRGGYLNLLIPRGDCGPIHEAFGRTSRSEGFSPHRV